jgi:hypothetical protein
VLSEPKGDFCSSNSVFGNASYLLLVGPGKGLKNPVHEFANGSFVTSLCRSSL